MTEPHPYDEQREFNAEREMRRRQAMRQAVRLSPREKAEEWRHPKPEDLKDDNA